MNFSIEMKFGYDDADVYVDNSTTSITMDKHDAVGHAISEVENRSNEVYVYVLSEPIADFIECNNTTHENIKHVSRNITDNSYRAQNEIKKLESRIKKLESRIEELEDEVEDLKKSQEQFDKTLPIFEMPIVRSLHDHMMLQELIDTFARENNLGLTRTTYYAGA